jgi:hypothetical protein
MPPGTAAVAGGRSAQRDWQALRRLLLLDDARLDRALKRVQAAQQALHGGRLWDSHRMARWREAHMEHLAARERLAGAVRDSMPVIVEFMRELEDTERRALAGPIRAYAGELVGRRAVWDGSPSSFELRWARAYALRVAGAGCFTGADATAAWLARRDLQTWSFQAGPQEQMAAVLEVLRDRDPEWLADVARRLATRLRPGSGQATDRITWATTSALVRRTGIDPPTGDGFVYGWVMEHTAPWSGAPQQRDHLALSERLRDDPYLAALVPRLFEVDQVGELLLWGIRGPHWIPAEETWPGALARLAAEGVLDRASLLDRCLGRLLRGGRSAALGGFVALHEALVPALDELAARTRDYLRLLPDAQPAVAALAQRALRQLDDAGRLDTSVVVEASRAVLFRAERKLVRAQLAWLDAAGRRRRNRPDELAELLGVTVVALGQDAAQLQERALSLIRRHAGHATPTGRAALLHAGEGLADDVRHRLAEALGDAAPAAGPTVEQATAGGAAAQSTEAEPSWPGPQALPPPIRTAAELAEELAALLQGARADRSIDETLDPVALERVLAALVALAHADRAALHEAIAPVLLRYNICPPEGTPRRTEWEGWATWLRSDDHWYWYGARTAVGMVAAAAAMAPAGARAGGGALRGAWRRLVMSVPKAGRHPLRSRARQAIVYRLREIGTGLLDEPVPVLLATTATTAGHVDPSVLVDKVARAEREGWQPWELDLQLALLRLPRQTDPEVLEHARRLRSPAGRRLAERLRAGPPPDPALDRLARTYPNATPSWAPGPDIDRTLVLAVKVEGGAATRPRESLTDLLFDLDPPERVVPGRWWDTSGYEYAAKLCWPALLPSHRDLAAAHLLPALSLLPRHSHSRGAGAVLPLLAEADGPVGTALTVALAAGLGAAEPADRAAAADALVILAGRRQLDGAALGRELAALVALGLFPVQRIIEPLRDVARSGAHPAVWDVIAATLPPLLPPAVDRAPQRLAGLVALGAEVATPSRARGAIPALTALAERGGSSQLTAESRRLHRILTSN